MESKQEKILFTGESMLPTLKAGDRLSILPVEPHHIAIGDIAVLYRDGAICHRIVGKYKAKGKLYFLERGDNRNCSHVNRIAAEKLIGKVTAVETREGQILSYDKLNSTNMRLRCLIFGLIYRIGNKIKILFFGNRQEGFPNKIGRLVARALNYLI